MGNGAVTAAARREFASRMERKLPDPTLHVLQREGVVPIDKPPRVRRPRRPPAPDSAHDVGPESDAAATGRGGGGDSTAGSDDGSDGGDPLAAKRRLLMDVARGDAPVAVLDDVLADEHTRHWLLQTRDEVRYRV